MTVQKTPLTIWCNAGLDDGTKALLEQGTYGHRLILSPPEGETNINADVAFGQPPIEAALSSNQVRWIQVTSAGYTRFDRDDVRSAMRSRGAVLTNSSGVINEPCAQHLLAMMLALARQLPQFYKNQLTDQTWNHSRQPTLLNGQTVLFLGFGAIGQRLAQLLQPFDMRLIAVRRSQVATVGIETIQADKLEGALSLADHVINTLPDNPTTARFVNAERINQMKPDARFYNIGRGTTVDPDALVMALQNERIASAYLDVTDPEPLPATHPLWNAPNCFITPHVAGSYPNVHHDLIRHFLANLTLFENGEKLRDQVF